MSNIVYKPEHFTGEKYSGNEKIYARHFFCSTVENTYERGSPGHGKDSQGVI